MNLISVYESFLYYCCLAFIAHYIMGHTPGIRRLLISFVAFIPLIIFALSRNESIYYGAFICFSAMQFIFLKVIFRTVKITNILFTYVLINCVNILIITMISTFIPLSHILIDVIVNTATATLCVAVCLTKMRRKIITIINWLPNYVLVVVSVLLISASLLSVVITGSPDPMNEQSWNKIINFSLIWLLFAVCIVFPILIINSISNSYLKTLTANYEQQIQAQAEHYKNLAAASFETRRFKHDFKNMSIAMEALLAEGETAEALNLIRQWNETLNDPNTFHPAFDTGNGIADALLTDKSAKASACNTEITFQGAIPADFLSPTDLCVILGNTLDNAMDACQKLPPEIRKTIAISCRCSSGFLFVSITNPVSQKVMIQDNHVVTTKENKTLHGFGLYSLHSVVKKYNGEVRLGSTNDSFTTEIDLCIPTSVMFMQKTA